MLYVILCFDKPGQAERRRQSEEDHRDYLATSADHVRLAGPLVDETNSNLIGSFVVYEGATLEEAEAFAAADPHRQARLLDTVVVKPWRCTTINMGGD